MITNFFNEILNMLFPRACIGCGTKNTLLCSNCIKKIPALPLACFFCGGESLTTICLSCRDRYGSNLDEVFAAVPYEHPVIKKAVKLFKYHNQKQLSQLLGKLICRRISAPIRHFNKNELILIPIPLSKQRLRDRGYNQAELLAKYVSQQMSIRIEENLLQKIRHTPSQVSIGHREERLRNLKGSFMVVDKSLVNNKTVILIDDVATTGATLIEAGYVLKPVSYTHLTLPTN